MAIFGSIDIRKNEIVSYNYADEYNIITGYRSSQFLGRKARSATLRLSFNGADAAQRLKQWQDLGDLGNSRGLILVGSKLEGIFGIQKIDPVVKQEINGVITRIVVDIQLVEDASQKVR